jgi:hypothetical protein
MYLCMPALLYQELCVCLHVSRYMQAACIKSWLCTCTVLACTADVYHDVPARIKSLVCVFCCCMYQELAVYLACTADVYHDVPARIKSSVCVFLCCMYQELAVCLHGDGLYCRCLP